MTTARQFVFLGLLAFWTLREAKAVNISHTSSPLRSRTFLCEPGTVAPHGCPPVFSEDVLEIIQSIHDTCVASTGVAEEDITNCESGIFKEDPKLKCYMFCLFEEASLTDDDGVVDYEMFVSFIPEEYAEKTENMLFACRHLDTPDKDKCERSFEVHKCCYTKDPDLYFLL